MSYDIVPEEMYLNVDGNNYLTPVWFNKLLSNINANAMNNSKFLRPVQVTSSSTSIQWKDGGTETVAPASITLKEVGGTFIPDGWTAVHTWALDTNGLYTLDSSYSLADAEILIEYDSAISAATLDSYIVTCQVVYTETANTSNTVTTSAAFGLPLIKVNDGANAIDTPLALISAPSTHQPLSTPGGIAKFEAKNVSLIPEAETKTSLWSLSLNGASKNQYIDNTANATASINIPEIGKEFILTLVTSTTETPGVTDTTTVKLYTYDYGSFLFSSWNTEGIVQSPTKVNINASSSLGASSAKQIFPTNEGNIEVKWGYDITELTRINTTPTDDVFCVPGFTDETTGTYSNAVSSVMTEYGLPADATIQNYSIININDGGESLVGQYFWAKNMSANAKILYKSSQTSWSAISGNPFHINNSVYLIEGVASTGSQNEISVGPGAERYYIWLKHYALNSSTGLFYHKGQFDQYTVISQGAGAAGIKASFNGVPVGAYFKAEVVSANGSAYAPNLQSEDTVSIENSELAIIDSVDATPTQYGVRLDVSNIGGLADEPIGFLTSYKELAINTSWPSTYTVPFGNQSSEVMSIYSVGKHIKLPATIGKKVVASVRAVMADGTLSAPSTIAPISVNIPWSYLETGLSKGLGRLKLSIPSALPDKSIKDDATLQYNLFKTSFGRDVYIESIIIYAYDLGADGKFVFQSDNLTDSNDEKDIDLVEADIAAAVTASASGKKYIIGDLSIPVSSGSDVLMAIQGSGVVNQPIDIEVELHYSNGTIVTASEPLADPAGAAA